MRLVGLMAIAGIACGPGAVTTSKPNRPSPGGGNAGSGADSAHAIAGSRDAIPGIGAAIRDPDAYCELLMKDARARYKESVGHEAEAGEPCDKRTGAAESCATAPGEPSCAIVESQPIRNGGWLAVGTFTATDDSVNAPRDTQVAIRTKVGWWLVGHVIDCGSFRDAGPCTLSIDSAKLGRSGALEIEFQIRRSSSEITRAMTCTYGEPVACTDPIDVR